MNTNRLFGLLWGGGVVVLLILAPWAPTIFGALPACSLKVATGFPCPGCGSSRAAMALARFDFGEALSTSPLAAIAWILLILGGLIALALACVGRRVPEPPLRLPSRILWLLGLAVVGNWIFLILNGR